MKSKTVRVSCGHVEVGKKLVTVRADCWTGLSGKTQFCAQCEMYARRIELLEAVAEAARDANKKALCSNGEILAVDVILRDRLAALGEATRERRGV